MTVPITIQSAGDSWLITAGHGPPPWPRSALTRPLRPPSVRRRPRRSTRTHVRAAEPTETPKPWRRGASAACPPVAPASSTHRRRTRLTREVSGGVSPRTDNSAPEGPVPTWSTLNVDRDPADPVRTNDRSTRANWPVASCRMVEGTASDRSARGRRANGRRPSARGDR